MDFHGLVCRVEFDREMPLVWQYGGIWWQAAEANDNRVAIDGPVARITEPNLPNGLVLAGWDGQGAGRVVDAAYGQQAEFTATRPRRVYHSVAAWGVTRYDRPRAARTIARLDTPNASQWPRIARRAQAALVRLLHRPRRWSRKNTFETARRAGEATPPDLRLVGPRGGRIPDSHARPRISTR